jgi:hypothetical protein
MAMGLTYDSNHVTYPPTCIWLPSIDKLTIHPVLNGVVIVDKRQFSESGMQYPAYSMTSAISTRLLNK